MTKHRRLRRRTVTAKLSEGERKRRTQAYQKDYYLAHREEAKEYQRVYNLTYKKKPKAWSEVAIARPAVRSFNPVDIQRLSPEKIISNWSRIVR